jgi:ribosomal protein L5
MHYKTIYELNKDSFKALKEKLNIQNPMEAPKLMKVVVSNSFGSVKDKRKIELIADRITKITGQKPAQRATKKAIAKHSERIGKSNGA